MPDETNGNVAKKPKHYTLRPTTVSISAPTSNSDNAPAADAPPANPFLRAPQEDDDGYDPFSDRREEPSLFERDPWA